MTVDPFGPTPLNQPTWEASHAKEVRFGGAFMPKLCEQLHPLQLVSRLTGLTQDGAEKVELLNQPTADDFE
jgi:hypothetical protein